MENSILFIADYFDPKQNAGGAPVSLQNLVRLISSHGYKSTIISRNKYFNSSMKFKSKAEKSIKSDQQSVYYIDGFLPLVLYRKFQEISFSMIYLNSFFSTMTIFSLIYFIFSRSKKKIILSTKGELYYNAMSSHNLLVKKIYIWFFNTFLTKNVTFHFSSEEEYLITKNFLKITNYYLAADIYENNILPFNDSVKNSGFNIVFLSRIDRKKNLEFACNVLTKVDFNVNFDIYGTISDNEYFNECMKILGTCSSNIKYTYKGVLNQETVRKTFSKYDVFIFPTKGENFGFVILESLDSGCPVLLPTNNILWNNLIDFNAGFNIGLDNLVGWTEALHKIHSAKINKDSIYINGAKNYTSQNEIIKNAAINNLILFNNVCK